MKFYTQRQLTIALSICFLLGFLISGFSVYLIFQSEKHQAQEIVYEGDNLRTSDDSNLEDLLVGQNQFQDDSLPKLVSSQESLLEDEQNTMAIYQQYNSAVVNISTEVIGYNWLFEAVPREGSSGSGAIISEDGYILTNTHVVEKAYKVYVTLSDGDSYEGVIIGRDPENDLAVLKIDVQDKDLTVIPFGSSDSLQVGQKVLAIGNPFGYDRTLTQGIISGVSRPVRSENNLVIKNMIQTDASINPGNSGGPLLNSAGQLIGINTIIYSPSGGSVGIGFAVPVDTARRVIPDLIRFGKVNRGWIDIIPVQINQRIARYAQLPVSQGILISSIPKDSLVAKSGLRGGNSSQPVRYGNSTIYFGGDIITHINDAEIRNFSDLFSALETTRPGDKVTVTYLRGRKEAQLEVILSDRSFTLQ